MSKYAFPQYERIKTSRHFNYILDDGDKYTSGSFVLYSITKLNPTRQIGFITSRKLGNSVVRNHSKRKLKEMVRHYQHHIHKQFDLLFIARHSLITRSHDDLCNELAVCIQEASLWID